MHHPISYQERALLTIVKADPEEATLLRGVATAIKCSPPPFCISQY